MKKKIEKRALTASIYNRAKNGKPQCIRQRLKAKGVTIPGYINNELYFLEELRTRTGWGATAAYTEVFDKELDMAWFKLQNIGYA